jgi:hypothetical protein
MKTLPKLISFTALALVIIPPILYLVGSLGKPPMTTLMLIGTLAWFATVPLWMGRRESE